MPYLLPGLLPKLLPKLLSERLSGFLPGQRQDVLLFLRVRVSDLYVQQEAVKLCFGQRVSALLLDGILGCHNQIQLRQAVGFPADGDLPLGHGFEQRRLHLGRCPVHFISQDQVVKQRAALELKGSVLRPIDLGAGQVGGQQVGRELHAVKVGVDAVTQHLDGAGLGQPRRTFHQQMSICQQGQQQPVHQLVLADDMAGDERLEPENFGFI